MVSSKSVNFDTKMEKIAEINLFYEDEEAVKMLFSSEWSDREHALYLLE